MEADHGAVGSTLIDYLVPAWLNHNRAPSPLEDVLGAVNLIGPSSSPAVWDRVRNTCVPEYGVLARLFSITQKRGQGRLKV
jgi:hypothetical protein